MRPETDNGQHVRHNQILDQVEPSKAVTLLAKLRKMQETDPDILNFTGGDPDFATPTAICEEAYRQMLAGNTHYVDSKGDPLLRNSISRKLSEELGADYPADCILITPGAKYAVYLAVQSMINPGDEVLWLTPGWVSYPSIITQCRGIPVAVHLDYAADYAITMDKLEQAVTEQTRMLILNYPNNPTGRILTAADLSVLKEFLRRHPQIFVISDEIYEKIIYDGRQHLSLASDPEFTARVILINGFSKCSAMTGWRIGYLACAPEIFSLIQKIFQHSMSCVSGFIQKAAITALQLPDETERMRAAYERRRNILYEGIRQIPKAEFKCPEGSFYAWVRFDSDMTSEELCAKLLENAGIGGIPGSAYGDDRDCTVRFCYAAEDDTLVELAARLARFCSEEL